MPFLMMPLGAEHNRQLFSCGNEALDRYLRELAVQDMRRMVASCFVAVDEEQRVWGYYTLSSASIPLFDIPAALQKKLPRYPEVPATRLGRLAVDASIKGQGYGGALLADAITKARRSEIASFALFVEAKGEQQAAFYRHHEFIPIPDEPLKLFLPLASAHTLFR